jgi:myo-inositol-1(or 4)-monophosphatase
MTYEDYLKIALEVSEKAGEYLVSVFGEEKEMFHKEHAHYGIKEDKIANDLYEKFLKEKTPEIGLYTEEGEQDLSKDLVWVVDPIDGTSNFRVANPFFNTQIALLDKGEPVVAVVFAPILNQRFQAIKNMGAFLNGKKISVTSLTEMQKSIISIQKGPKPEDSEWVAKVMGKVLPHLRSYRNNGSTGVELCFVAAGMFDGMINHGSALYDYAPGVLLVREAGGVVTNFEGKDWTIEDRNLVASNLQLKEQILKIL